MRILYVEDNALDAELTCRELARAEAAFQVEVVTRVAEAWNALARAESYDLVLADLSMPDGSGLELLVGIRQKGISVAVVILTGSGDEKHAVAALKAGVDDYLVKRGDYLKELPQVLESALAAYRFKIAKESRPLRVLYAEHNAPDIEITARHLARQAPHIQIDAVHTGMEALERIAALPNTYDALLLDYRLTGLNALDVLRELQTEQGLPLPVVLVTGQGDEEIAVQALRLGAAEYLVKHPGYLHELPAALESAHHRVQLRKERAALRLSESSRILREQALGAISQGVLLADSKRRIIYANSAVERFTGYTEAEIVGKNCSILQGKETDPATVKAMRQALDEGRPFSCELINYRKDGSTFWNELSITPVRDDAGRVINFVGVLQDVSARKNDEAKLKAEKLFSDTLVSNLPGLVFMFRKDGRIVRWNRQLESKFDFTADDLAEITPFDFIAPEDKEKARESMDKAFAGGVVHVELTVISKTGNTAPYFFTASRLVLGDEVCVLGVGLDIAERRQLEEQLRQSQKMEAIGQLSGGIAHDFNNLLTVISGNVGMVQSKQELSAESEWYLQEVAQAARRAANLTRQLLTFSRQQKVQLVPLDLNAVIENMTRMLSRILGEDVAVQYKYGLGSLPVTADAGMLEQVLLNLAVNARDAMPQGGKLQIETVAEAVPAGSRQSLKGGEYVRLSVRDTGTGIAPEDIKRIFEPFFTKKDVGKGTGLGLATVYGIVEQHNGWIDVDSQVGRGTTFHVYLPRGKEKAPTVAPVQKIEAVRKGTETILLVEDEPAVRMLVCMVLENAGYKILEAASGVEALKFWRTHRADISLILTDFVMPDGMSGRQLAEQVLAEEPNLRVIFTSGYNQEVGGADFVLQEGVNFLAKPFELAKLVSTVRRSLDSPPVPLPVRRPN